MENILLEQALSSKDYIEDPYTLVSELMEDMLIFIALKRKKSSELSETELNKLIDEKHKQMIEVTINNIDELLEKTAKARKEMKLQLDKERENRNG